MDYKAIKVSYRFCESDKFYRILLVKKETNLFKLGVCISTAFSCSFEYSFCFIDKGRRYLTKDLINDNLEENDFYMNAFDINDLSNQFEFIYGDDEKWIFDCQFLSDVEFPSSEEALLYDGVGKGIVEHKQNSLIQFFVNEEMKDDLSFAINECEDDSFSDFYSGFDLAFEQELFYKKYFIELLAFEDLDEPISAIGIIIRQLEKLDFVREVYKELIKRDYTHTKAIALIGSEYMIELCNEKLENRDFDEKIYENELKKLI